MVPNSFPYWLYIFRKFLFYTTNPTEHCRACPASKVLMSAHRASTEQSLPSACWAFNKQFFVGIPYSTRSPIAWHSKIKDHLPWNVWNTKSGTCPKMLGACSASAQQTLLGGCSAEFAHRALRILFCAASAVCHCPTHTEGLCCFPPSFLAGCTEFSVD